MKKKENVDLGALITAAIETAKIKQGDVIAESGISRSSFYRAIGAGGKASKPNVVALVSAIIFGNKYNSNCFDNYPYI